MTTPLVKIPVTYKHRWDDDFGARGWKLDCSIQEPSVIAATAEAGQNIPTSVLIHDMLDHHLCGVDIGGHRNEAIALIQLAIRTGADPRLDYAQIVEEDLMHDHINGEPMASFLPEDLLELIPSTLESPNKSISLLRESLGDEVLRKRLIEHFFNLGQAAKQQAESAFRSTGLDYTQRTEMGLCLQKVLQYADKVVKETNTQVTHGIFRINQCQCGVELDQAPFFHTQSQYAS